MDPAYKGRIGVYDSYRDTMSEVLLKNGISDVNTNKQSDIDLVQSDLLEIDRSRRCPLLDQRRL